MDWNLINDQEFGSKKLLKLKNRRGGPNNSDILQNWFPPEIRSPLFNLYKFQDCEKSLPDSCRMDWNLMNDKEFGSKKLLKLKNRRGEHIIQTFCKIGFPQQLGPPPPFNLYTFQDSSKSTPESYRIHWNVMNDEEIGSRKLLKLKYRRGGTK